GRDAPCRHPPSRGSAVVRSRNRIPGDLSPDADVGDSLKPSVHHDSTSLLHRNIDKSFQWMLLPLLGRSGRSRASAVGAESDPSQTCLGRLRMTHSGSPPNRLRRGAIIQFWGLGCLGAMDLMVEERAQRRLAAILAADVVGYSRLMGEDETGTLAALKDLRQTFVDPVVAEYRGRLVKLM